MVQLGFIPPNNDVHQKINGPDEFRVGPNATAASMIPGIFVIKDTYDYSVKQSDGSGNDIGVLAFMGASPNYMPETLNGNYSIGDKCGVWTDTGVRISAWLTTGQSVVYGQPLKVVTGGTVSAAGATERECGTALQTLANSSGSPVRIWIKKTR